MKTKTVLFVAAGAVAAYYVAKSQGYDLLCGCTYGKLWNAVQGKPAAAGCGCGGAAPTGPITSPAQVGPSATQLMPIGSANTGSVL